jgi:hypothetical protein
LSNREFNIQQLEKRIRDLLLDIDHINAAYEEKEQELHRSFAETLKLKKVEWDLILKSKEHELQEVAKLDLKKQEEQHATYLAEQQASHKKQVDDLRNFYSVSTLNAKKVIVIDIRKQKLKDYQI